MDYPLLPPIPSLMDHRRAAQGTRGRADWSRDRWHQDALPAPALGMAVRGCHPRQVAARQDRSVRRRGTVQAEATRLYSAGLGASQRALTGASVEGIPEGRFYQEKVPSKIPPQGIIRKKLSIGFYGGKSSGYTVVRLHRRGIESEYQHKSQPEGKSCTTRRAGSLMKAPRGGQ